MSSVENTELEAFPVCHNEEVDVVETGEEVTVCQGDPDQISASMISLRVDDEEDVNDTSDINRPDDITDKEVHNMDSTIASGDTQIEEKDSDSDLTDASKDEKHTNNVVEVANIEKDVHAEAVSVDNETMDENKEAENSTDVVTENKGTSTDVVTDNKDTNTGVNNADQQTSTEGLIVDKQTATNDKDTADGEMSNETHATKPDVVPLDAGKSSTETQQNSLQSIIQFLSVLKDKKRSETASNSRWEIIRRKKAEVLLLSALEDFLDEEETQPSGPSEEKVRTVEEEIAAASESTRLWIFGYGSILWKTGFRYNRRKFGYVKGFVRRFWQGNITHRGDEDAPGRVATLVDEDEGTVWGAAYELIGEDMVGDALDHLGMRECTLGGYAIKTVPFFSKDEEDDAIDVLMFNATEDNHLYMGPSSIVELAEQIVSTKGNSGHNVEYVTKLADFMRTHIPEDNDAHLFKLDKQIRTELFKKEVDIHDVGGTDRRKGSLGTKNDLKKPGKVMKRRNSQKTLEYRKFGRKPSFLDNIGDVFVSSHLPEEVKDSF